MEQKIIWKLFLTFGTSLLLSSQGCTTDTEPLQTVDYVYKNESGVELSMEVYNRFDALIRNYTIIDGGEIITNTTVSEVPAVFSFKTITDSIGDSIAVKFVTDKCLYFRKDFNDRIFSIKEYDNYSEELTGQRNYRLEFIFKERDLMEAVDCN
ncbi:MAG: hypothetical protein ACI9SG_002990 [Maribacter sp.]|jgi:hypothetical protein